jgi:hypothetical protein
MKNARSNDAKRALISVDRDLASNPTADRQAPAPGVCRSMTSLQSGNVSASAQSSRTSFLQTPAASRMPAKGNLLIHADDLPWTEFGAIIAEPNSTLAPVVANRGPTRIANIVNEEIGRCRNVVSLLPSIPRSSATASPL